jgi:hypothetical protein
MLDLPFCCAKDDVPRYVFPPTIRIGTSHCHNICNEVLRLLIFRVTGFIDPSTKIPESVFILSLKIWRMSFLPFCSPVLPSLFNPPGGPLITSSPVSFGLQSSPYTGGFKTWFKVWWKGFWENIRITKRWFFSPYSEWPLCSSRTTSNVRIYSSL